MLSRSRPNSELRGTNCVSPTCNAACASMMPTTISASCGMARSAAQASRCAVIVAAVNECCAVTMTVPAPSYQAIVKARCSAVPENTLVNARCGPGTGGANRRWRQLGRVLLKAMPARSAGSISTQASESSTVGGVLRLSQQNALERIQMALDEGRCIGTSPGGFEERTQRRRRDEAHQDDARRGSSRSGRRHPCRAWVWPSDEP